MTIGTLTILLALCSVSFVPSQVQGSVKCRNKWIQVGYGCYYIERTRFVSFSEASKYCADYGGRLAEPKTKDEYLDLKIALMRTGCRKAYYLGIKRGRDGKFNFLSNNLALPYTSWAARQPDKLKDEFCVETGCPGWNDLNCDRKRLFICQMEDEVTTTTTALTTTTTTTTSKTTSTAPTLSTAMSPKPNRISVVSNNETRQAETSTMIVSRNIKCEESDGDTPLPMSSSIITSQVFICLALYFWFY